MSILTIPVHGSDRLKIFIDKIYDILSCWGGGVGMGLYPALGGIFADDGWRTHRLSLPTWMDKYDLDPEIFL